MDKFISKSGKSKRRSSLSPPSAVLCDCSSAESDLELSHKSKRNKISKVWKYFKRSDDKKFAKCLSCGKEYKTSGNTSNLQDHLKRFHPTIGVTVSATNDFSECPSTSSTVTTSSSSSARSSMNSVSSYFKRAITYDNYSKRKQDIDKALAYMIAKDLQPFNIVENEGFVEYSKTLDPRYTLPSKTHLREVLIKDVYTKCVMKLENIFENVTNVAITCDCWTSAANENYLTVTSHFIYNFEMHVASLSTTKLLDATNHSAENTAKTLKKVLMDWKILDKTHCVVTDNANVMQKACNILNLKNLPCYAHTLNLVVQDSLKLNKEDSFLKPLYTKCKAIVRFFKKSSTAFEKFKSAQKTNSPLTLLQDVPTRWNSFFFMIKRIIETNDAISQVLLSSSNAPVPLNADEIIILKEVEKILQYFQSATEKISGSNYITVSLIIPISYGIHRKIEQLSKDLHTTEGKMLQENCLKSIKKRLFSYEKNDIARISTVLDPRFKKIGFECEENAEFGVIGLENEMVQLSNSLIETQNDSPPSQNNGTLFEFLQERTVKKISTPRLNASAMKRKYLDMQNVPEDIDPLIWMKVNFHF